MSNRLLAQDISIDGQTIKGPVMGFDTLGGLVNTVIQFLIPLSAVILLFVLIWGGYEFLMSRGEPGKVKSAQAKITSGIIGFVIIILAYSITKLLAFIFNLGDGIL